MTTVVLVPAVLVGIDRGRMVEEEETGWKEKIETLLFRMCLTAGRVADVVKYYIVQANM